MASDAPNGRIQLIFPYDFSYGLGNNVRCFIPELLIGPEDPMRCKIEGQRLTFENTKPIEGCPCVLNLEVFGVVNPNKQAAALSSQITVIVFQEGDHVQAYQDSTGTLDFFDSAPPIDQEW